VNHLVLTRIENLGKKERKNINMKIFKVNEYNTTQRKSLASDFWNKRNDIYKLYKDKFIRMIEKILEAQPEDFFEDFDAFPFGNGHVVQGIEEGGGTYIFDVEWDTANWQDAEENREVELHEFDTEQLADILRFFETDKYVMNNLSLKYIKKINN